MPDIKHKLHYRGVNWKKVHKRQEQRWAAKSGEVSIVSPGDPEKLKEFRKDRNAKGLNISKKKKLTKAQRREKRLAKQQLNKSKPAVKSLEKNKAILNSSSRVTPAGYYRAPYEQPPIGPDPFTKLPNINNNNKKKKKSNQNQLSGPRKRSTGDEFGGLPVVKKEK